MSVPPALALRRAVHQTLVSDVALSGLLGGPRVYDEPPRALLPPYVTLGDCASAELPVDGPPAAEHAFSLDVWSREGGLSEALKAADRIVHLLDGAELTLDGCRLVSIAWRATDAARTTDGGFRRAAMSFRAVTEAL